MMSLPEKKVKEKQRRRKRKKGKGGENRVTTYLSIEQNTFKMQVEFRDYPQKAKAVC